MYSARSRSARFKALVLATSATNKITLSVHLQQLQMHLSCRSKSRAQHGNAAATPKPRERPMEFGYFTLSDNHYDDNPRARQPVRRRHHRRGALCRPARHAFGLDRRASFQLARRAVLPRPGARLYRGAHQAHPARAGRHRAAAAPSDPGRRAMGDARSAEQRPRRFRRRPRLRPARIRCRSTSRSRTTRRSSRKAWSSCARCGRRRTASRITASIISSTMCASRRSRCSGRSRPMSRRSRKPSIELAARLGCGLIVAPFAAAMSFGGLQAGAPISTTRPARSTAPRRAG